MNALCKTVLILSLSLFFMGCNTLGVGVEGPAVSGNAPRYHKQGPPPHAPAHGYRYKHQNGYEMQYDSGVEAYVVLNIPETYFGNNLYIRFSTDGRWMVCATLDGNWKVAAGNEIPPKLKLHKEKKSYTKDKKKKSKNGKGHKKNKYDDNNDYDD